MPEATWYEHLGGEARIRPMVQDIVVNRHNNPVIKPHYYKVKKGDAELLDLVVNLICAGTGGTQENQGMDMRTAHRGMNISEAELIAVLDNILAALEKHNVGERGQAELLAISYGNGS